MSLLNKKAAKHIFKERGIRTNNAFFELLDRDIHTILTKRARMARENRVKTLTDRTFWMSKTSNMD